MNKIAQYLNQHIIGEVTSNEEIREYFSRDGSVLNMKPTLVAYPRTTNDVRKIARFTWQLAEKGHVLPITTRGCGTNQNGSAIGKGIIVDMSQYLNNIIFINPKAKDQFIHLQSGSNIGTTETVLQSRGLSLPTKPKAAQFSTVGGFIADNGFDSSSKDFIGKYIKRLEVVLANGDVIETARINKHELNKKKGLETFEGEIYRKIDGIIEDNSQLINDQIIGFEDEHIGYSGIGQVKRKDGSFDLTPLMIGSQGTLGIISEVAIKTVFDGEDQNIIVASFSSSENAHDIADEIAKEAQPARLDLFDGALFDIARSYGKQYIFSDELMKSVLYIVFDDSDDKVQKRKLKRAIKLLNRTNAKVYTDQDYSIEELSAIQSIDNFIARSADNEESILPILNGSSIPPERREEFIEAVQELGHKHSISLPMKIEWLSGVIDLYPALKLNQVSDKQKVFKLIKDYIAIVIKLDGNIAATSGEGRLKTLGAYEQVDTDLLDLYEKVRQTFDPYGTLNPDVKQKTNIKKMASELSSNYNSAKLA